MPLDRILWDETERCFVLFNKKNHRVNVKPIRYPSIFRVSKEDERNIEEHAPEEADAYCSGKIVLTGTGRSTEFAVQYYKID